MSRYSGKCDLYDHFMMIGVDENTTEEEINEKIGKSNFYIYLNSKDLRRHKLDIHNIHDLIPYYPYLISCGCFSKDGDNIFLSSRSFVDSEEDERFEWVLRDGIKYWRKCKRNKVPYVREEAYKAVLFFDHHDDYQTAILDMIAELGDKATIDDVHELNVHTKIHEYYRNELYETMVSNGYTEAEAYHWCFGDFIVGSDQMKRLRKNE